MEALFVIVPIFIGIVFLIILVQIGRQVAEWAYNNGQPVLSVAARVVTKRNETSSGMSSNNGRRVWTSYYVTFELKGGERKEFSLYGSDYGMLAEGDQGTLTYQIGRAHV